MSPRCQTHRLPRRRGMVAVQVVLMLSMLVGVVALTVDGGMLISERRHVQAAADAAALAGAVDLFKNYQTGAGLDLTGSASGVASATATANYAGDPSNLSMTIHIPPTSAQTSYYNNRPGYVEVDLTYNQARGFSAIWGSSRIPVHAHAIARGQWTPADFAILTLTPTGVGISVSGGGNVQASGGSIFVDSNDATAMKSSGGSTVSATSINVVGGVAGGGTMSPTPTTNVTPIQDPLMALAAPPPPSAGAYTKIALGSGNFKYTFSPGSYDGNGGPTIPKLSAGDVAVFKQASTNSAGGIYYLYNGLNSTGATISMDPLTSGGLMFYNAGTSSSQGLAISGNSSGSVALSGLDGTVSSTLAYKGLVYFQARGATEDVSISGNGSFVIEGTIYAPSAALKITGNTSVPPSIIGSQYIAASLVVGGSGTVLVDHKNSIVTPTRHLKLVE